MMRHTQPMPRSHTRRFMLLPAALLCLACLHTPALADGSDEKRLVEDARQTFESFIQDPNLTWFQDHVKDAKAVLIIPQQLRGAFFLGAGGGSGVLLVHDETTDTWSQPAFYTMGGLSFGFQFGADASEVILMAMTDGAVENLYSSSFKLGGDASIAAGPYGGGVEGSASTMTAAFLSFARSKGVYAGVSLEGEVIYANDSANEAYYGKKIRPVDIIVKHSVENEHSARLRKVVADATKS